MMALAWPVVALVLGVGVLVVLYVKVPKDQISRIHDELIKMDSKLETHMKRINGDVSGLRTDIGNCLTAEGAEKLTKRCNDITEDMVELKKLFTSARASLGMRATLERSMESLRQGEKMPPRLGPTPTGPPEKKS